MSKFIDLTGMKFGKLTVVSFVNSNKYGAKWLCKCECDNEVIVKSGNLNSGNTKSCGCNKNIDKSDSLTKARQINIIDNTSIGNLKSNKVYSTNTSGIKGVCRQRSKWIAYIYFKGKQIFLGCYTHKSDAAKARKEAEEKYWKPFLDKIESLNN